MKTRLIAGLLLLAALGVDGLGAARESFNYYLVIDVSGSMAGRPAGSGNANIMPRVKEAVGEFLARLAPGCRVAVLPFDVKVHDGLWVTLASDTERGRVAKLVRELDPRGPRTCIYSALMQAFRWDQTLKAKDPGARHVSTFLVFTDGLNDCDDSVTLRDVLQKYRMIRGPSDFLYYTTLGVELPAGDKALLAGEPGVRYVSEPRGALEPISLVEARPAALDFGDVGPSGKSARKLALAFDAKLAGTPVEVSLDVEGLEEREAARVRPEKFTLGEGDLEVTLELINPLSFRQRKYSGILGLTAAGRVHFAPGSLPVEFSTLPPRSFEVASTLPLPVDFGELPFSADGAAVAEARFLIQPSASVESTGAALEAAVSLEAGNPSPLAAGRHAALVAAGTRGGAVTLGAAARELKLVLALPKADVRPGEYRGRIVLSSSDAELRGAGLVAVAGGSRAMAVPFAFRIAGERVVLVAPAAGAAFPLALGTAVQERIRPDAPAVLEAPVAFVFSPDAVSRKASLRADLELAAANPSALGAGADVELHTGGARGASVMVPAGTDRLVVRARVPAAAKPGTYRGRILLWPSEATLGGAGLEPVAQSAQARSVAFAFEVEPEKRLTLGAQGWQGDLGTVTRGEKREQKVTLVWSSTAARAGATARLTAKAEPPGVVALWKAGTQAGASVVVGSELEEATLSIDVPAGAPSGGCRVELEVRGDGCEVGGVGFEGSGERVARAAIALSVARPLWQTAGAVVLLVIVLAAWGYAVSIPRFSALARLTVEEGEGAPGAYYLRGHQGRFSREIWVGGRGAADLGMAGLAGRAFALRPEQGGRTALVASSPVTLTNPETGVKEELAPGRSAPLAHGAEIEVAGLKLVFHQYS